VFLLGINDGEQLFGNQPRDQHNGTDIRAA
jgi:hypothetical protein